MKARLDAGGKLFRREGRRALRPRLASPKVRFHREESVHEIEAQFVAGCDGFTACRARRSRRGTGTSSRAPTRSAGSASWWKRRPRPRSSSMRTTSAASPSSAPARRRSSACTSSAIRRTTSKAGPTRASGRSCTPGSPRARAGSSPRAASSARHHRDAQLRGRADALRAALPRRRRGPHRPAHRREGPQPRRERRARPRARARRVFQERQRGRPEGVLGDRAEARVARRAFPGG